MEYVNYYTLLMDKVEKLCKTSTYDEMYELGKKLNYMDRIRYDLKVICTKKKETFQEIFSTYIHEKDFLNTLIERDELDYILEHIGEIIRSKDSLSEPLLEYLNNNIDRISKKDFERINLEITRSVSEFYPNAKEEDINRLKELLENTAKEEGTTLLSLRYLTYGGYSKIYKLKNKIIKVGCARECEEVVDNSRILIPLFKGKVGHDFVEIADYIENDDKISYEDIYGIYKELRDQGVIWLDSSEENLRRLSKKNAIDNNNRRKNINGLGIIPNPNSNIRELYEGDLIIIDLDHMLFDYEEDKIAMIKSNLHEIALSRGEMFNKRYNEESKKLIKKK